MLEDGIVYISICMMYFSDNEYYCQSFCFKIAPLALIQLTELDYSITILRNDVRQDQTTYNTYLS